MLEIFQCISEVHKCTLESLMRISEYYMDTFEAYIGKCYSIQKFINVRWKHSNIYQKFINVRWKVVNVHQKFINV